MTKGNSITNVQASMKSSEAIKNLEESGFTKSIRGENNNVIVMQKDDIKFSFYEKSTSEGVPSAAIHVQEKKTAKIRFDTDDAIK